MKAISIAVFIGLSGVFVGFGLSRLALDGGSPELGSDQKKSPEVLYWVAPMDANFRRDEPGLSPMGMALMPVYKTELSGMPDMTSGVGGVRISPNVQHNLGVRTAIAKIQRLPTSIQTVGFVQYDQDKLVHLHPRVEGWIDKLYVNTVGDIVEQGQPIYELYSPELVNAQEDLLLAIGREADAKKPSRLVVAAADRLRALQVDERIIEELLRSGEVKQNVTFYAPISGVADELNIREGFFVEPNTTLMSIGTLDQVWVEVEVFERQSAAVTVGQQVSMQLDYFIGREWIGVIDYIYPELNKSNRTLRLRIRFDNVDALLKPNMYAKINIDTTSNADVLVVPSDALIRTGEQTRVVLAFDGGVYKSIAVRTGKLTSEFAEIREGISIGDRVVTSAQFLLDSESSKTSDFKRMNHPAGASND